MNEDLNECAVSDTPEPAFTDGAGVAYARFDVRPVVEIYTNPAMRDVSMGLPISFSTFSTNFIPSVDLTMSKSSYSEGNDVTACILRVRNTGSEAGKVEVKIWLASRNADPTAIMNFGADGSVTFPGNLDVPLAPLTLFTVRGNTVRGSYGFNARVLDPVTGAERSVDLNPFSVQ